eukprot:COSAG04_NODE_17837_length_457_cov_1.407821_2_plen_84_part_01
MGGGACAGGWGRRGRHVQAPGALALQGRGGDVGEGLGMLLLSVLLLITHTSPPTTTSTGPPPCPCSPSSLCSSLSPQPPHDRQE